MSRKRKSQKRIQDKTRKYRSAADGPVSGISPGNSAAILNQAASLAQSGGFSQAEELCLGILRSEPENADALHLAGIVNHQQAKYEAAVQFFCRAISSNGDDPGIYSNLGLAYCELGQQDKAISCFAKSLALDPGMIDALYNMGRAFTRNKEPEKALECYLAFLRARPHDAQALNNAGMALAALDRHQEAIDYYRQALRRKPNMALAHNNLGNSLGVLGRDREAHDHLRRAETLQPGIVSQIQGEIGMHLRSWGRMEEAEDHLRKAISLRPENAEAYITLFAMCRLPASDPLVRQAEELLADNGLMFNERVALHFSLGKIYDDIREYDRAFAHYRQGNALKNSILNYRAETDVAGMRAIAQTYDRAFFSARRSMGSGSERPIFIVGMPRSGTTLIEQILASHSQVAAGGELTTISGLIAKVNTAVRTRNGNADTFMAILNADTIMTLANEYLAHLQTIDESAPHITDKMPGNFMNLGFIRLLFPRARIIFCQRHPADTCLSCFFQRFANQQNFSYDLENLGKYYSGHLHLMRHWEKNLPGGFLTVRYEDVVEDIEAAARRILEFCGLEWENNCLEFYRTERKVETASVAQVRRPIYRSSLHRWRNYEKHLAPLLNELNRDLKL